MVDVDKKTIDYLTELSRIGCTEDEKEILLGDLKKILKYMEMLNLINTEGVEPTRQVFSDIVNVFRDDIVDEMLDRKTFLDNSPSHTGGMIRVPPILKGDDS